MKRILDVFFSIIFIILFLPIMIGLYLLGYLFLKENPIFFQTRLGLNNEEFTIMKFKSMKTIFNDDGLLSDNDRLNLYGKILRASSLDEILEFFNILKGDMSFVGPRPLVEKVEEYTLEQLKRHSVKPGLTGYAQVNGLNDLSFNEKIVLDLIYVENNNLIFDFQIILKTFGVVLNRFFKIFKNIQKKSVQLFVRRTI